MLICKQGIVLKVESNSNLCYFLHKGMSTACRASGDETLQLLSSLKNMSKTASVPGNIQGVEMTLKDIERVAKVIWRYSVCAPVFVKCV